MLFIYAIAIFTSAALLFTVQPMVGKMMLPVMGGSPAIWNTCLVFFQAALLVGYAYAHLLAKIARKPAQVGIHIGLLVLAALTLPIHLPDQVIPPVDASPVWFLLKTLALTCGAPFAILSATAPLLQRWFAMTDHKDARDPYFLYAASNAGSLLSLLAYPLVLERSFGVVKQADGWAVGFAIFVVLTLLCGIVMVKRTAVQASSTSPPSGADYHETPAPVRSVRWVDRAWWVALSAVPSSLLMGCTQYITTDVAAFPLFWVLPLAIYLVTFIIAFSPRVERLGVWPIWTAGALVPLSLLGLVISGKAQTVIPVSQILSMHLCLLFGGALSCHLVMARKRPVASRLTEFFLLTSLGGVLGGSFNALLAPVIFNEIYEYQFAILAAGLLVSLVLFERRSPPVRLAGLAAVVGAIMFGLLMLHIKASEASKDQRIVHQERSFFGVLRVLVSQSGRTRSLVHGTTNHGVQRLDEQGRSIPTSYYHASGPVGEAMKALWLRPNFTRFAVVGLGTGAIAAYGRPETTLPDGTIRPRQQVDYYEIDPAVARIAQDNRFFTFLDGSAADVKVVLGDARQTLASAPDEGYSLIVLDAFSSDAIPTHLLTLEALDLYRGKLREDGILLIHISNRHLNLGLMLGRGARELGMISLGRQHTPDDTVAKEGGLASTWVAIASNEGAFGSMFDRSCMDPKTCWFPFDGEGGPLWTDDFADILSCMVW